MARGFNTTYGVGSTDAIVTTNSADLTTMSLAVWTYRHLYGGGNRGRMLHREDASGYTVFYQDSVNGIVFNVLFGTSEGVWLATAPSADAWHHLAVTYDRSSAANVPIIYLDGSAVTVTASPQASGTYVANAGSVIIGNSLDTTRVWDGMLAEAAGWNRILTAGEVTALAARFSPLLMPQGLVYYEPMVRDNVNRIIAPSTITGTAVQPHPRIIYSADLFAITKLIVSGALTFSSTDPMSNLADSLSAQRALNASVTDNLNA